MKPSDILRRIWGLALPNILSNVTVPLLMLADTAMAGRMATADSIAAVAIGAAITQFVIGIWSLLRMGTTGFTAQAWGACDVRALLRQLTSGSIIALSVGLLLILLRPLYVAPAAALLQAGADMHLPEAQTYLHYSFLGAPAALLLYVYNGWLIGVQRMKLVMSVSIACNLLNILFSYLLAFPAGMGVGGLALGTVLAQYTAVLLLALGGLRYEGRILRHLSREYLWHPETLVRYFHVGKYLLIRTLLLQAVMLSFIRYGGAIGVTRLAANSLLMQLFTLFSYFMGGFAYAGEALTGRYIGARRSDELRLMIHRLFRIGTVVSLMATLLYLLFPAALLSVLSDKYEVIEHARRFAFWAGVVPIASFAAFLWDGVFVGATASKAMRRAMTAAFVVFFATFFLLRGVLGETALWLAFVLYLLTRSLMQTVWYRRHFFATNRLQRC